MGEYSKVCGFRESCVWLAEMTEMNRVHRVAEVEQRASLSDAQKRIAKLGEENVRLRKAIADAEGEVADLHERLKG